MSRYLSTFRKYATQRVITSKEIEHFNQMAEEWWDPHGPVKLLHTFNRIRVPFIQKHLDKYILEKKIPKEKLEVLEVGCGGGIFSEGLAQLGYKLTAIDPSVDLIAMAKMHAVSKNFRNLEYMPETVEQHVLENSEKYDVVVSSETIEHVPEKESFLRGSVQCLKPGGSIFISSPNKTWRSALNMIFIGESVSRKIPKGTHEYSMFIHQDDVIEMLKKEGCTLKSVDGLFLNFVTDQWSFHKNTNYIYLLHAVKN